MLGDLLQQLVQLRALVLGSSGSRNSSSTLFVIRAELEEPLLAARVEADEMAAAVVRIALALDQALLLELVEQPDQPAAVVAERVGDLRLRLARALVEDSEHGVVVRVRADLLEGLDRPLLDRIARAA